MAVVVGKARVWCNGERNETSKEWYESKFNGSYHKLWGVSIDDVHYLQAPRSNAKPTGVVRPPDIHGRSPDEFSNIFIENLGIEGNRYRYRVHIGTLSIREGRKRSYTTKFSNWMAKSWPWGFLGMVNGSYWGQFEYNVSIPVSNSSNWVSFEVDKTKTGWQQVANFSHLCMGMHNCRWRIEPRNPNENPVFKIEEGTGIVFGRYTDDRPPYIIDMVPGHDTVVVEDLRPEISAAFEDFTGSGIDISKFRMVIDEGSIYGQVEVIPGVSALALTDTGFQFVPREDLKFGPHTVRIHIEDHHGNVGEAEFWFQIEKDTPLINILKPANGEITNEPRPIFSGEFEDAGSGIDVATFKLVIDGEREIKEGASGLVLTANGYSYKSFVALEPGLHTYDVNVSDNTGNVSSTSAQFDILHIPFNPVIGDLPLAKLERIGGVTADKYDTKTGGRVTTVKDLINEDPWALFSETGIALSTIIDNVKRARIACVDIRFNRMQFGELWDRTIYDIAHMTDQEILDYDVPVDELGNPIVEAQIDLKDLRENMALLFVCLDDSALRVLTFGQIVSNQPEGTYW